MACSKENSSSLLLSVRMSAFMVFDLLGYRCDKVNLSHSVYTACSKYSLNNLKTFYNASWHLLSIQDDLVNYGRWLDDYELQWSVQIFFLKNMYKLSQLHIFLLLLWEIKHKINQIVLKIKTFGIWRLILYLSFLSLRRRHQIQEIHWRGFLS